MPTAWRGKENCTSSGRRPRMLYYDFYGILRLPLSFFFFFFCDFFFPGLCNLRYQNEIVNPMSVIFTRKRGLELAPRLTAPIDLPTP